MIDLTIMFDSIEQKGQTPENIRRKSADINSSEDIKKVAKEMESLFAYQLVKIMRETSNSMSSNKEGLGYNTYMTLFDMEVSKIMAERGLGLQESIIKSIDHMQESVDLNNINDNKIKKND